MAESKTEKTASSSDAGKVTLTTFWNDSEGWAGTKGKQYAPEETVKLENPEHVQALRNAGYVAGE